MSRLFLAPMEGLADFVLRDILTGIGGFDLTVSEFIRVTGSLLPRRTYERYCPELRRGGYTTSGIPVILQLLGSDTDWLARNAARAATFSAHGIDLNFGCPAKLVNKHGGGAMLLDDPARLYRIVHAVRSAVPANVPVTAKMRLGIHDTQHTLACAQALAESGAAYLVVHARTRDEGYRPPAHWEWIARIREAIHIPVIANGEVWTVADWRRCREISGCADVMIGRGAVADPWLALRIKGQMAETPQEADWQALLPHIAAYWIKVHERVLACHAPGRLKLLLAYWARTWPQAAILQTKMRRITDPRQVPELIGATPSESSYNI